MRAEPIDLRARPLVPPAPRWAHRVAHVIPLLVLPSCLWRITLGIGVPVGFTGSLALLYAAPGWITLYVVVLSLFCEGLAMLSWGLVQPWGCRIPPRTPLLSGRIIPTAVAVVSAGAGVIGLTWIAVGSVLQWNGPENMGDPEAPHGWAGTIMTIAYAPMLLWPPLLAALTVSYWRRRRGPRLDPETVRL